MESTFESAKADAARRRKLRHAEHVRIARKLNHLLIMLHTGRQNTVLKQERDKSWLLRAFATSKVKVNFDDLPAGPIKHYVRHHEFEQIIDEPAVQQLLEDMDISVGDWVNLFDVLDADGNRLLDIGEIVHGLMKLRGGADKCDVVSLVLMVRAIQSEVHKLVHIQKKQGTMIENIFGCFGQSGVNFQAA